MCLDSDGSLTDASVIALLAALSSSKSHDKMFFLSVMSCCVAVRLPSARVNEDTGLGEVTDTRDVRLQLTNVPVATTFGLFDDRYVLV